jgi:peptide/nickel transport system permease protein
MVMLFRETLSSAFGPETGIFGGAIITEQVFKVNGIGQLLITAIQANDLPLVQTLTFIFAVLIVLFNLIADILYGLLDPRIRYE